MEKLMNVEEVSELLNVSVSTVRKWVHTGFIPHVKLGKRSVRFEASALLKWLEKTRVPERT